MDTATEPTLFSQSRFVNAFVHAMGDFVPVELESSNSQFVVGVKRLHSYGRQSISLAPFGLYAHPSGSGDLGSAVRDITKRLKSYSTTMFEWNVRFDHFALAEELRTQGIPCLRTLTHVLQTDGDYEETFARFDSTARNLVRRARREGLAVRTSNRAEDVSAYYDIHVKLASTKGNYKFLYPPEFFDELLKLDRDVAFIVAEHENKMIGGAWFFRDGDTLLYWHSAMDLAYSKHSPTYAILDYAIRMAHNERRCFFNFGSSCGMSSLERFKIKWGAEPRYCWHFHWQNPLWETVQKFRSHLNSYAG